jgi:phosphate transport system permease protein
MQAAPGNSEAMRGHYQRRRFRYPAETLIHGLLITCGLVSLAVTALILVVLLEGTYEFFSVVPLRDFFFAREWQPLFEPVSFGIWELVAGTLNVVFWSLLFAVPLGLAAAIYLSEYAPPLANKILKPLLEALAGVPTVVYAYFALTFITLEVLRPLLGDRIGVFNSLGASIVMAVMVLPTIASLSEDAMHNVPRELREGAYALGATRLEVATRVVLPAAFPGVMASILLGIARVVGETMIVAVAAGSTPNLTLSPLSSIQTMTGFMLQIGLGDADRGSIEYGSLFAVGSMLFLMTLIFNVAAQLLIRRFQEQYE